MSVMRTWTAGSRLFDWGSIWMSSSGHFHASSVFDSLNAYVVHTLICKLVCTSVVFSSCSWPILNKPSWLDVGEIFLASGALDVIWRGAISAAANHSTSIEPPLPCLYA